MGEETSEQLDIIPGKVPVLQHVCFKYPCRQCNRHGETSQIVTSPMPAQPLPGSNASAGTVATILTAKYADGMPLYLQHDSLLRSEVDVARRTLNAGAMVHQGLHAVQATVRSNAARAAVQRLPAR